MFFENLKGTKIILASKSPRRNSLLKEMGLDFEVLIHDVDESFPQSLCGKDIASFIAEKKADPFIDEIDNQTVIITADTIVYINGEVLGKPGNYEEAFEMLQKLSGQWHQVITGVCLLSKEKKKVFTSETNVLFKPLSNEEIEYYINNYRPYDKAGAYGIQEWIGLVAIEKIDGSYFNVMGLPVQQLYEELNKF
ncbi:MAG TPA: Maf family nucleotide pyrophosphatase [Prolixibacteraceae bacterium]|nr:Maf family nucleotide pyrophosphatase [Prolixibacteraceae bacterium]HPS12581.1 Maf family nucleotide pyrophosphatase [Prolixibacteraceae bacterium]